MGKRKQAEGEQGEPKRVKVELVQPERDEMPGALAAYFPCGLPQGVDSYEVFENASKSAAARTKHFTVLGRMGKVQYVGTTESEEYAPGPSSCNYAVGVYNRETGVLEVMPVAGGRLLRMEPRLPGLSYKPTLTGAEDDGEQTREERLAQNKKLVESFGSTRRRRQLNAREEGVVRVEKLGDATGALTQVMGQLAADAAAAGRTKEQMLAAAMAHRALPPHNLEGTTPATAYPLDKLIPEDVKGGLHVKPIMNFMDPGFKQDPDRKLHLHEYVRGRLHLMRGLDKGPAHRRAQLLSFLSILLKLRAGKTRMRTSEADGGMDKLFKSVGIKPDVLEPLLAMFFHATQEGDSTKYDLSKERDTLLVAYICVTALLLEPTATVSAEQFSELASALSMMSDDLAGRFREVGAVCKSVVIKTEDGTGTKRSYQAILLPSGNKTLKDSLAPLKLGKRK